MALTVGDTAPALTGTCTSAGAPVNLTGADVALHIRKPDATVLSVGATLTDAAGGAWSYSWAPADLDAAGTWKVEAQVTFSSGAVQTFGPETFYVNTQIA